MLYICDNVAFCAVVNKVFRYRLKLKAIFNKPQFINSYNSGKDFNGIEFFLLLKFCPFISVGFNSAKSLNSQSIPSTLGSCIQAKFGYYWYNGKASFVIGP